MCWKCDLYAEQTLELGMNLGNVWGCVNCCSVWGGGGTVTPAQMYKPGVDGAMKQPGKDTKIKTDLN